MQILRWTVIAASLVLYVGCGDSGCGADNPTPQRDGGLTPWVDAGNDASSGDRVAPDRAGVDAAVGRDRLIDTPDPNDPDNATNDSDCDGLSDAEEFGNLYGSGEQTDPGNADSDGDGLLDGVEAGRSQSPDPRCAGIFVGDADPATRTDPTNADSDGDGLCDGPLAVAGSCEAGEDTDGDGRYDVGPELDPRNPDTDHDGRCDGPNDVAGFCTGGDPDPYLAVADSDGDGLADEIEQASGCLDENNPDVDGDGLCDGPRSVAGVCSGGEDLNGDG
ncbi:MAG: VWA domain-containing protein, partial [Deltaproteobacteria bacterium]|nr:VWA domain-containing protein [Deltaproteobacteria bacterium]